MADKTINFCLHFTALIVKYVLQLPTDKSKHFILRGPDLGVFQSLANMVFLNKTLSDVGIVCGQKKDTIPAHKWLLSCSPVLREQFLVSQSVCHQLCMISRPLENVQIKRDSFSEKEKF
jgi:hypothetical protein